MKWENQRLLETDAEAASERIALDGSLDGPRPKTRTISRGRPCLCEISFSKIGEKKGRRPIMRFKRKERVGEGSDGAEQGGQQTEEKRCREEMGAVGAFARERARGKM